MPVTLHDDLRCRRDVATCSSRPSTSRCCASRSCAAASFAPRKRGRRRAWASSAPPAPRPSGPGPIRSARSSGSGLTARPPERAGHADRPAGHRQPRGVGRRRHRRRRRRCRQRAGLRRTGPVPSVPADEPGGIARRRDPVERSDRAQDAGTAALQSILRTAHPDPLVFEVMPLDEMREAQMYPLRTASWIGSLLRRDCAGVERVGPVRRADLHPEPAHARDRHPHGAGRDLRRGGAHGDDAVGAAGRQRARLSGSPWRWP